MMATVVTAGCVSDEPTPLHSSNYWLSPFQSKDCLHIEGDKCSLCIWTFSINQQVYREILRAVLKA